MITVQSLIDTIRRVGLDAEPDSDYYDNIIDIIPAINASIKWCCSLIDYGKSKNKKVSEGLRDLSISSVYQLNKYSRFSISDSIWTIDAIYPIPKTEAIAGQSVVTQPDETKSVIRTDLIHIESNYSCARLTIEEWSKNKGNPFAYGNTIQDCCELNEDSTCNVLFGYLDNYKYSELTNKDENYFEVRPYIPLKLVTVFYVKTHPTITAVNQNIFFPESMRNLLYEKALQFISYSQGDKTNLYSVSEADLQKLLQSIN